LKKKEIIANLPLNLTDKIRHYFVPRQKYFVREPKVHFIKNAFVSEQGLVIKNLFLSKYCAFNLLGKDDNTFYWPYWRLSLEQMLVSKFGKSLKSINLDTNQNYLLIYTKWFNYSFWVNSCLVRLIMAEKEGLLDKCLLLFPENWHRIEFVKQSLSCFDVKVQVIPEDHHLFVQNLYLPETREWTASFYPPQIQDVRRKIVPFALEKTTSKEFPKRIYLTRKKRNVRCVENESEILPILKEFDFTIINFEDYSFWDQVALMNHAETFVSVHGAGFSNAMFMKPGSSVLELINEPYAEVEYQFPFWKLSSAAQLNYYAQLCALNPNASKLLRRGHTHDSENKYLADENIVVDIDLFIRNIELICATENNL
jgi:hypothetical protein